MITYDNYLAASVLGPYIPVAAQTEIASRVNAALYLTRRGEVEVAIQTTTTSNALNQEEMTWHAHVLWRLSEHQIERLGLPSSYYRTMSFDFMPSEVTRVISDQPFKIINEMIEEMASIIINEINENVWPEWFEPGMNWPEGNWFFQGEIVTYAAAAAAKLVHQEAG